MKTSLAGAMEIIGHEGIVLQPYKDSVGVWTIGIGHTAGAGSPDPRTFKGGLTLNQAIELFRTDLAKYEKRVNSAFKVPLRQHEFDAAVSFDYNTGAIHKATWVKSFNAGKRDQAIREIMNWTKPPEIKGRRQKEQSLFATGLYTGAGFATVYPAVNGKVQWSQGKRVDLTKEYGRISDEPIKPAPAPVEPPKPVPAPVEPPTPEPAPVTPPASPVPERGWFATLIAAIAAAFAVLKGKA